VYIVPANPTDDPGRIGLLPPDATRALAAEFRAFFALYPAWLTQVDTPEHIIERCVIGLYEPWMALDEDGTPEILGICGWERHKNMSFYHILYIGGKNLREHLVEGMKELEKYVYMNGGSEIIFTGRPGWSRLLAPYGYGPKEIRLSKNVTRALGH
jgi:hypothetical protein